MLNSCWARSWINALLVAAIFASAGCQNLRTRNETKKGPPQAASGTAAAENEFPGVPQPETQKSSGPPTFLNQELPKVGLILGPGGMKAYAHLGVLREFHKARIPVHAVVGLEWGALIGALYAVQGQVNDAEWKAFKLREEAVGLGGFFSSRTRPQSVAKMESFFNEVFASARIEQARVPFGCPAHWWNVDRFGFLAKGAFKEAMRACLPYPPLFTDNNGVTASPGAVDEAAAQLRSLCANLIILVNVLGKGEFLPTKAASDNPSDNVLWSEIRYEMMRARSPHVHFIINVDTTGHPITDFAGRRALLEAGAKSSAEVVEKLVQQYGF